MKIYTFLICSAKVTIVAKSLSEAYEQVRTAYAGHEISVLS